MTAYCSRRTLVIGGFGYIGSHVVGALTQAGADVTVVTPRRERHAGAAARLDASGGRTIEADVRDGEALRTAVAGQDVIFNLSGQSGALRSVEDPQTDLDVNCRGNLTLLEAMRKSAPHAKIVFAGSRLVYGAPRTLPVTEDHPLAPVCPHGAHKALVERYIEMYGRLHGIRSTTLRITNPYGPGQPEGRSAYGVINYLIQRALAGQTVPIYGDGAQQRDYVFVSDVVNALLAAGAGDRSDGRVYNVGSGIGTAMIDMARAVVEIAGGGRVVHEAWPPLAREIDTGSFVADVSRIGVELGWRPTTALADGLRQTIAASVERCDS